jgi:hypothetical protein
MFWDFFLFFSLLLNIFFKTVGDIRGIYDIGRRFFWCITWAAMYIYKRICFSFSFFWFFALGAQRAAGGDQVCMRGGQGRRMP